jgi:hypothetical protein
LHLRFGSKRLAVAGARQINGLPHSAQALRQSASFVVLPSTRVYGSMPMHR